LGTELIYSKIIKLKINIYEDYAHPEDFFIQIEQFNKSNKGIIEVEIIDPLSNKNPQVLVEEEDVICEAKEMALNEVEMLSVRENMSEIMSWLENKLFDYVVDHYWDAIDDAIDKVLGR